MKKTISSIGLALLVGTLVVVAALHSLGSSATAGGRYKITSEARREGVGYRHVVIVRNKSRHAIRCTVWTDVDPQPPVTDRVRPRSTREITTSTQAGVDTFVPFGFCQRE